MLGAVVVAEGVAALVVAVAPNRLVGLLVSEAALLVAGFAPNKVLAGVFWASEAVDTPGLVPNNELGAGVEVLAVGAALVVLVGLKSDCLLPDGVVEEVVSPNKETALSDGADEPPSLGLAAA